MSSHESKGGAAERDTALWHPFSDMALVRRSELVLTRGEGVWLWDQDGRRYLDASASLWYCNVGHGRREIADAVAAQMAELEAYSTFGDMANVPALKLAERLSELAPMDDAKVPDHGRRRGDRLGGEDRPALLVGDRPAQPPAPDQPDRRLPRHERLRHEPRRH
jgi:hypothetical protein